MQKPKSKFAPTHVTRWMQFQTCLPAKNDFDPIVGIALAGDDNRIRAVANSLRLPLTKTGRFSDAAA